MEGVTLSPSSHPVDVHSIYQKLLDFATEKRLLSKATKYSTLHSMTYTIIMDAYREDRHYSEVVFDLLEAWFTSLAIGLEESGDSWSHYWDLDLEVEGYLRDGGYPMDEDDDDDDDDGQGYTRI